MPTIAKTVVADLSKQGKECFCVDGKPFPWWISEEGPSARKFADDLYVVHVEIICTATPGDGRPEGFSHGGLPTNGNWPQPVLLGEEFPWAISQEGITYRSSGNTLPTVGLEFFSRSVSGMPVEDADLPEDGTLRDAIGQCRARLRDGLLEVG